MESIPQINIHTYCDQMDAYLQTVNLSVLTGWKASQPWALSPLAQGEYNMNFLLSQGNRRYVVRANTGSQIGLSLPDQIRYEYGTLKILERSGVTPKVYFCDASCQTLPMGVILMEYLAGEKLDYRIDNQAAARLFAQYHQIRDGGAQHLIVEESPLSFTYQRCLLMVRYYWDSPLADPQVSAFLKEIFQWADEARWAEVFYQQDPWHCVINTEVNNGNFIKNTERRTLHLVDWEKPLWGDPSQDLSHFRVPTTTLWKTDVLLSDNDKKQMMAAYKTEIQDRHLKDTIEERTRLRDPFNCLRGVSWCAMAWVKYQAGTHILKNDDTWRKLSMYTSLDFLHKIFDGYLKKV